MKKLRVEDRCANGFATMMCAFDAGATEAWNYKKYRLSIADLKDIWGDLDYVFETGHCKGMDVNSIYTRAYQREIGKIINGYA